MRLGFNTAGERVRSQPSPASVTTMTAFGRRRLGCICRGQAFPASLGDIPKQHEEAIVMNHDPSSPQNLPRNVPRNNLPESFVETSTITCTAMAFRWENPSEAMVQLSISVPCSRRRKTGELLQQAGGKDTCGRVVGGNDGMQVLTVFAAAQFVVQ